MSEESMFLSGRAVEFAQSSSGKPKVKIDDGREAKWYFAGKTDISGMSQGQAVDIEYNTFKTPDGKATLRGLNSWAASGQQGPRSNPAPGQPRFPSIPTASTSAQMPLAEVTNWVVREENQLRFISNQMQALITEGKVLTADHFNKWFRDLVDILQGKYMDQDIP